MAFEDIYIYDDVQERGILTSEREGGGVVIV